MAALLVMLISHGVAIADGEHKHTNRLIDASSPYLLQHAHNPVNWYSWGSEAFDTAKREDKPIFLSIGYAACHWCHVMERESFENEGIAAVLNEHFISIKVDREERPDLDEVYMAAVVSMTGRGGWPMSIFMTPDRKPFDGGTYFPPNDRGGRRGLRSLCLEIASKWSTDRDSLMQEAGSLARKVNRKKQVRGGSILVDPRTISRNVERLAGSFDSVLGGRRSSRNKFPPTMAMELMLREYASQTEISKPRLVDLVETTLTQMARGGIYDHIGGGICRYSTDPRWFAPHFEKMLYDQGTVSGVYLSAYQLTENDDYARVARGILDYCISDLQSAAGGFFSSRDADSEGEEGKFYVWRRDEIESHLSAEDAKLFCDYYNVTRRGNWHHGQNILHVKTSDEAFATKHNLDIAGWRGRLGAMQDVLRQVRSQRVEPGLDDKILTEWNGLIITSLARAYRILDEPRYRVAASSAMEFILTEMMREGRLYRAHRHGKTHIAACAADYANIIEALITLYETTFDRKWLGHAEKLNDAFIQYYWDAENGGFFYTAHDAEKLIVRSKNLRDGVVPSANSTAILNFLRLAVLTGRTDLRDRAADTIRVLQPYIARGALERAQWAALFYHNHPREIAIVGDPADAATQALVAEVYHRYLPGKVVAVATPEQARSPEALPLLRRKTLLKGKPAAYVCRNYLCGRPVSTPADLSRQLDASSP